MKPIIAFIFLLSVSWACQNTKHNCNPVANEPSIFNGVKSYTDYNEGVSAASYCNKPILLMFTGLACVSDRHMERIMNRPEILEVFKNDYTTITLMVDDKTKLPIHEIDSVKIGNRMKALKTKGDQNLVMQVSRFETNAQPFFALLSPNGKEVYETFNSTRDTNLILSKLKSGLRKFKKGERVK